MNAAESRCHSEADANEGMRETGRAARKGEPLPSLYEPSSHRTSTTAIVDSTAPVPTVDVNASLDTSLIRQSGAMTDTVMASSAAVRKTAGATAAAAVGKATVPSEARRSAMIVE